MQTLGSNEYLPSDEATATLQFTDDFTRNYGKHSFKMGMEFQNAKFSTLQPVASHGYFQYSGTYTDIPNQGTMGGMAQFLLTPIAAPGDYQRESESQRLQLLRRLAERYRLEHQQDVRREEVSRLLLPGRLEDDREDDR